MWHKLHFERLWLWKDVQQTCAFKSCCTEKIPPHIICLCQDCCTRATPFCISSHGFPLFRAPPACVRLLMMLQGKGEISCKAGQELSGRYFWRHGDIPPRHPSPRAGKQFYASACCAVLGDDADLLVRQRKCQPSPKSSERDRKGLTSSLAVPPPHGVLPALPALLI